MGKIDSCAELISKLCGILGTDAYGSGGVSVKLVSGGRRVPLGGGGICLCKGCVSAAGYEGREALIGKTDDVCKRAVSYRNTDGGILRITPSSPARLEVSEDGGFMRFERDIEIIYRGDML